MLRAYRIIKRSIMVIFTFVIVLALALQLPLVQNRIAQWAYKKYLVQQGVHQLTFDKLHVGLTGKISAKNIQFVDDFNDTLYINKLSVKVGLIPLLMKRVSLRSVSISDAKIQFIRTTGGNTNFKSLIDRFAGETSDSESSYSIAPGKLKCQQIEFRYVDSVQGLKIGTNIGKINLNMSGSDLANLQFGFGHASLADSYLNIELYDGVVDSVSENQTSPRFSARKLTLSDFSFQLMQQTYDSVATDTTFFVSAHLLNFLSTDMYVDIDQQLLAGKNLELSHSKLKISIPPNTDAVSNSDTTNSSKEKGSIGFGWNFRFDKFIGTQNYFHLNQTTNANVQTIDSSNSHQLILSFELKNLLLNDTVQRVGLSHMAIQFDTLPVEIKMDEMHRTSTNMALNGVKLQTSHSVATINLDVDMAWLKPQASRREASSVLMDATIGAPDIFLIAKLLGHDTLLTQLHWPHKNLNAHFDIRSSADTIYLQQGKLSIKNLLYTHFKGTCLPLPTGKHKLNMALDSLWIHTASFDPLAKMRNYLPDTLSGNIQVLGATDSLLYELSLGNLASKISSTGILQLTQSTNIWLTHLETRNWPVQRNLQGETVTAVDLLAKGSGHSIESPAKASGNISLTIDSLRTQYQTFTGILLQAQLSNGHLQCVVESQHPELDIHAKLSAEWIDSLIPITYSVDINRLMLKNPMAGLKHLTLKSRIDGEVLLNSRLSELKVTNTIQNTVITKAERSLSVSPISSSFEIDNDQVLFTSHSDMLEVRLLTNAPVDSLFPMITRSVLNTVFNLSYSDTTTLLQLDLTAGAMQDMLDFFPISGDTLHLDTFRITLDNQQSHLNIFARLSNFKLKGIFCESVNASITKENSTAGSQIYLGNIISGLWSMDSILFNNTVSNDENLHTFKSYRAEKPVSEVTFTTQFTDDTLIAFFPDSVMLFSNYWSVSDTGKIYFDTHSRQYQMGWLLSDKQQLVRLNLSPTSYNIQLDNFDLSQIVLDSFKINHGRLSTQLAINQPPKKPKSMVAGLTIDHFVMDTFLLGDIHGKLNYIDEEQLDAIFSLKNQHDHINYKASGSLKDDKNHIKHQINFDIRELAPYVYLVNLPGLELKTGGISGQASTWGNDLVANLEGDLALRDVQVNYRPYNSQLFIGQEQIRIKEHSLFFDDFQIQDQNNNTLDIAGDILLKSASDMDLNLSVQATQFTLINTPAQKETDLYGKLVISTQTKVTGSIHMPKVKTNITIQPETNLTYVMEGSNLEIQSPEGIVSFVDNLDESDTLLFDKDFEWLRDTISQYIDGFEIDAKVVFSPKASYHIITNPQAGDQASFKLDGTLGYTFENNAKSSLSGQIEVVEGSYQISFYNLIQRTFTIRPGSEIRFSGPIKNTYISVEAINTIRTNSIDLLANELTNMSDNEKELYSKRLPYEAVFLMKGQLLNPEFDFGIDLPRQYRMEYPVINAKLDKLARPEMVQERNMQVFALMVSGGFLNDNNSSGVLGNIDNFATTAARKSVDGILTQQLNNYSSQYLKWVDVQFDLNSYENYQSNSSDLVTDLDIRLSKKLFNERVTVNVESSVNIDSDNSKSYQGKSAYNTDFSIIYNVTPDGRYRIKAFSVNSYDMLYGSEVNSSGVGFVFIRELENKPREHKSGHKTDSLKNE